MKKKLKPIVPKLPRGWKMELVYLITDNKGQPRAWSSDKFVAFLMAYKAGMRS